MVGLLLLVAGAVFTYLSIQVGALKGAGNTVKVEAVFDDAAGLVEDSAVRLAGVQVGWVKDMWVQDEKAHITLVLKEDAGLRRDVRARIRARSLLGEKYVHLQPVGGEAPPLTDGDMITDTVPAMEIDEVITMIGPLLSKVDPDDMASLMANLNQISIAAKDDGVQVLADVRALVAKLNDAADLAPELKQKIPALLDDLGAVMKKVNSMVDGADESAGKATVIVDRLDRITARLDEAAAGSPELVADIQKMVSDLKPSVDDLGRALSDSDELVADMKKLLHNLAELDEAAIQRLLREEGVLVRLKPKKGEE